MREEDDRPAKKVVHEVGQDLSTISIEELGERVELLEEEIGRLKAEADRKRASRDAASAFFKA